MTAINEELISKVLARYTYLHEHPELSFQEYATSKYICNCLKQNDIPYEIVGKTGVIGWIQSKENIHTIALRADMDALPIEENPMHTIRSCTPGIMHACGHDVHTACLLGAAEYLKKHQSSLPANVMLIFQPAEELLPGGAQEILNSEFFKAHRPDWIIALHAEPELPVGQAGICPGQYMASGDEIYITLRGSGGHAAFPEKTPDLILIASHVVVALQQITSRKASPFIPTVLTFGNIRCHSAMNIIPQEITLEGTFRTFNETWRAEAKELIQRISLATIEGMGASGEVNITEGYPSLYNDPEKARTSMRILESELGNGQVILLPKRMTTEDFARYTQEIPATFIRLGVKGKTETGKLHTPGFQADPAALEYGVRTLCSLVLTPSSNYKS